MCKIKNKTDIMANLLWSLTVSLVLFFKINPPKVAVKRIKNNDINPKIIVNNIFVLLIFS